MGPSKCAAKKKYVYVDDDGERRRMVMMMAKSSHIDASSGNQPEYSIANSLPVTYRLPGHML